MKNLLKTISILIVAVLIASCSQNGGMPPVTILPGGGSSMESVDIAKSIDFTKLFKDITSSTEVAGMEVEYKYVDEIQTAVYSAAVVPAGKRLVADITFTGGYQTSIGVTIESGSIRLWFNVSVSAITGYTAETTTPLSVKANGRLVSDDVSVSVPEGIANGTLTDESTATNPVVFMTEVFLPKPGYGATVTVDDDEVSMEVAENQGTNSGFASGNGTFDSPYVINTVAQYNNIALLSDQMRDGAYFYFSVEDNLVFSSMDDYEYIAYFRGDLDFNGNRVSGLTLANHTEENTLIGDFVDGTIHDLIFEPDDPVGIAFTTNYQNHGGTDSVCKFQRITTRGTMRGMGTNGSLFLGHAFGNTVIFEDCVNEATLYGTSYQGIFLGGYGWDTLEQLTFDHCVNNGVLVANYAGMLYGNLAHLPKNITVTECVNNGTVRGMTGSGLFTGHTANSSYNSESVSSLNGQVSGKSAETTAGKLTIKYDSSTNDLTISEAPAGTAKIEISAGTYSTMVSSGKSKGTFYVTFTAEADYTAAGMTMNFPKHQVVDKKFNGIGEISPDKNGNDIVTANGTTYYCIDEIKFAIPEGSVCYIVDGNLANHIAKDLTYSVYAYDSNGAPLAFKTF